MSALRIRRAAVAGFGAIALGAGMLGGAGSAQAAAPSFAAGSSAGASCLAGQSLGSDVAGRVTANKYRKHDPTELTERQVRRMESRTARIMRQRPGITAKTNKPIVVPVAVHVMKPSKSAPNEVGMKKTKQAIRIMNRGFAGKQNDAAFEASFRFKLVHYDVTANADWYNANFQGKDQRQMKASLRVGGPETLNLYYNIPGPPEFGLLGYATFPHWYGKNPKLDGVVVNIESNVGGSAVPFNRGDTLTHEVGHWLGLYHTFQGGCSPLNDRVSDTAPEAIPNFGCAAGTDTCTSDGRFDPIHNFMDYSPDACMYKFTRGQDNRMVLAWRAYRK